MHHATPRFAGPRRLGVALSLASISAISRGKWREPASKTMPEMSSAGMTTSIPAVRFSGSRPGLHDGHRADRGQGPAENRGHGIGLTERVDDPAHQGRRPDVAQQMDGSQGRAAGHGAHVGHHHAGDDRVARARCS